MAPGVWVFGAEAEEERLFEFFIMSVAMPAPEASRCGSPSLERKVHGIRLSQGLVFRQVLMIYGDNT